MRPRPGIEAAPSEECFRWEREDTLDPVARLAAQPAVLRALRELAKAELRARIRAARSTRERVTRQRMWARRYGTEAA